MKLWIAVFFTTDQNPALDLQGFLVRAPDLSECAYAAEQHLLTHPDMLFGEFDSYVEAAWELPQHAPGEDSAVLFGPVSLLGVCGPDAIYWRRDEGDPFWINVDELHDMKPLDECIYDDPRGWPEYGTAPSLNGI